MSCFGNFEHHFQVFVGDYIPNIWVMFNLNIYQPLIETNGCGDWNDPKDPWQLRVLDTAFYVVDAALNIPQPGPPWNADRAGANSNEAFFMGIRYHETSYDWVGVWNIFLFFHNICDVILPIR
jgi:hypothetical protein